MTFEYIAPYFEYFYVPSNEIKFEIIILMKIW